MTKTKQTDVPESWTEQIGKSHLGFAFVSVIARTEDEAGCAFVEFGHERRGELTYTLNATSYVEGDGIYLTDFQDEASTKVHEKLPNTVRSVFLPNSWPHTLRGLADSFMNALEQSGEFPELFDTTFYPSTRR